MVVLAFWVGIAAVVLYLLGYLQRKRRNIILFNVASRILYITQYILLSAFEGAVLDIAGIISSFLAQKKHTLLVHKYQKYIIVGTNVSIVAMGLSVYQNIYSLLPIIGVLLHTGAFWMENEKRIRQISLLGCPCWFAYNWISGAYGSCIGDVLSAVALVLAMCRYDYAKSRHP